MKRTKIQVYLTQDFIERVDGLYKSEGYADRSEFVRDCIREKMGRIAQKRWSMTTEPIYIDPETEHYFEIREQYATNPIDVCKCRTEWRLLCKMKAEGKIIVRAWTKMDEKKHKPVQNSRRGKQELLRLAIITMVAIRH